MNIFPPSVNVKRHLDGQLSINLHTESYYQYYLKTRFSLSHRKEAACIKHVAGESLHRAHFHVSVASQERSYSCYIQSLLIWGGGRGNPGLVCNFPAWLMPPTYHRKAKARPDIYLWGRSKAWESHSSQACIYSPAARRARDQRDYFCSCARTHIMFIRASSRHCIMGRFFLSFSC